MRNPDTRWLLPLILAGCQGPAPQLAVQNDALVTSACPGTRRIGVVPLGAACPSPAGGSHWSGGAMFPAEAPPELDSYCLYDWTGAGGPTPATLPALGSTPGSSWTQSDCWVVGPFAHPYEDAVAQDLEDAFFLQANAVAPLPTLPGAPVPTKVLIADSALDQGFPNPGTGALEHGQMMGLIVRSLACPPGSPCRAQVANQLALPLVKANGTIVRDEVNGGELGMFSDVARAIYDGYAQAAGLPGGNRIVVNLALGWAPAYGGAFAGNSWTSLDAPLRSVFSTITFVACRGGIVLAAAGNHPGGGGGIISAAYPAAWETKPAPNAARCTNLGGGAPAASVSTYRPLLYAVSGVDGRDDLLIGTREGGVAQLAAPGAHAAVVAPSGFQSSAYVGSSVATAAAVAVVAAAWTYLPSWSVHDVLDLVLDSGAELEVAPDFCQGTPCRPLVRRASMCAAITAACAAGGACGAIGCTPTAGGHDLRPGPLDLTAPAPDAIHTAAAVAETSDPPPSETHLTQYAAPHVHPQPPVPLCPTCSLRAFNNSLKLGISDEPGGDLSRPTLYVEWNDGSPPKTYDLDIEPVEAGATIEVTTLPFEVSDVKRASIQFVVSGDYASADQLIIEP